jgi:aromatic-amino-acid transaminase
MRTAQSLSTENMVFDTTLIPLAADRPGDDPIFRLNAEAKARAAGGESILNATIGALLEDDGKLAILPSVSEAIANVDPRRAASYAPISGEPAFLQAVIDDTFGRSELAPFSIAAATAGGTGALLHAITSFLEPGQSILVPEYYWGPYKTIASHTARKVETFSMFTEEGGFDLLSFEAGLKGQLEGQGRALIIFNFPCNNPTGYSLDDDEWRELSLIVERQAEKGPITFLVDLAYARFGAAGSERWVEHVEGLARCAQLLVAWSGSKAFAQYGARVGALIAVHPDPKERARLSAALGFACRGTWSNCNHQAMVAITELLLDPAKRRRVTAEREVLKRLLHERVDAFNQAARGTSLRYPRYEGGFFVSVFAPNAEVMAEKMRELGVFVIPLQGAVRVALCAIRSTDIPRLVVALEDGLAAAEESA